jgi:hypothetical protein
VSNTECFYRKNLAEARDSITGGISNHVSRSFRLCASHRKLMLIYSMDLGSCSLSS